MDPDKYDLVNNNHIEVVGEFCSTSLYLSYERRRSQTAYFTASFASTRIALMGGVESIVY